MDLLDGEWEWGDSELGKKVSKFENSLRCACCSDFFKNPQSLPCGHSFCSECIRRHLDQKLNPSSHNNCPMCRCTKSSVSDLRPCKDIEDPDILGSATTPRSATKSRDCDTTSVKRLVQLDFHQINREKVKIALEKVTEHCKFKLRTDGDKDLLEKRYREFVHVNNAQLSSNTPLSLEQVIQEVTQRENARDHEAKKMKFTSSIRENKALFVDLKKKIILSKNKALNEEKGPKEVSGGEMALTTSTVKNVNSKSKQLSKASTNGIWRLVMSDSINRPFFYNVTTETGQFEVPLEFAPFLKETSTSNTDMRVCDGSGDIDLTQDNYTNNERQTGGSRSVFDDIAMSHQAHSEIMANDSTYSDHDDDRFVASNSRQHISLSQSSSIRDSLRSSKGHDSRGYTSSRTGADGDGEASRQILVVQNTKSTYDLLSSLSMIPKEVTIERHSGNLSKPSIVSLSSKSKSKYFESAGSDEGNSLKSDLGAEDRSQDRAVVASQYSEEDSRNYPENLSGVSQNEANACSKCTFLNVEEASKCEMCGYKLPPKVKLLPQRTSKADASSGVGALRFYSPGATNSCTSSDKTSNQNKRNYSILPSSSLSNKKSRS